MSAEFLPLARPTDCWRCGQPATKYVSYSRSGFATCDNIRCWRHPEQFALWMHANSGRREFNEDRTKMRAWVAA